MAFCSEVEDVFSMGASHMSHVYDFYKPDLASEYPVVDGKLSQTCYLMALDSCYKGYCQNLYRRALLVWFSLMLLEMPEKLGQFTSLKGDESYQSRDLEKASQQVAKPDYDKKVQPATLIPKQLGNMYTASLYAAFASLIHNKSSSLDGKRIMMFSYGSGLSAKMWSLRLTEGKAPFSLSNIAKVMNAEHKLKIRTEFAPEKFVELMHLMEHRYGGKDFVTSKDTSHLAPGTYYLTEVYSKYRRFYVIKLSSTSIVFIRGDCCENTE